MKTGDDVVTRSAGASRLVRVAAVAILAVFSLALAIPAASASARTSARDWGWLRLTHLSPDTPAVDVYLYSFNNPHAMIVLDHVKYGGVSPYEHVPDGEYTVAMRPAGASSAAKPVLSSALDVSGTNAYTVAALGTDMHLQLKVFPDPRSTPHGKALVRVIQAAATQHAVQVTAGSTALGGKLPYAGSTSYQALRPGLTDLRVVGSSAKTSQTVRLSADSVYTLLILNSRGHLVISSLTDAIGTKVMPDGGAQTGFGGTAARPGQPLLPWAGLGVAGLAVAAAGLAGLSRRRRPAAHAR